MCRVKVELLFFAFYIVKLFISGFCPIRVLCTYRHSKFYALFVHVEQG